MRGPQSLRALIILVFLRAALVGPGFSQQPQEAPQERKPLILRPLPPGASANDSGVVEIGHLEDLASRLLHHAPDAGCQPGDCTILVTDFVFPDGFTSPNGIQWANQLSTLFASSEKHFHVVDRSLFKAFLEKERISAKLQNSEGTARWLGKQFNAKVVLVGHTRHIKDNIVELSARFLNVNDDNLIGPSSEADLLVEQSPTTLHPTDGLAPRPPLLPIPNTVNGEKVYQAGVSGAGYPTCEYMPNPPYTEAAREAHFTGTVIAEGVVGSDGALRALRIVKGAPFGLNEEVIKTMSTWRCKPAMLDGKPIATFVSLEANFRLFAGN